MTFNSKKLISLIGLAILLPTLLFAQERRRGRRPIIIEDMPSDVIRQVQCVKKSDGGICEDKQTTWMYRNIVCVEDCYKYGASHIAQDSCEIRNTCTFDSGAGCFRKSTCDKLDSMRTCAHWTETITCAP